MSEIKIYACDICGAQDAMHFVIPGVDHTCDLRSINGLGLKPIDGHVDLCRDHVGLILDKALNFIVNTADRRKFWKDILGK